MDINDLPIELLKLILLHVGFGNLLKNGRLVCRKWRKEIDDLTNVGTFWLKFSDGPDPEFGDNREICIIKSFDDAEYPAEFGLVKQFENWKMNSVIRDLPFLNRQAKNVTINFNGIIREAEHFRWLINFQQVNIFCLNLHLANGAQLIDWGRIIAAISCNLQEFRLIVSCSDSRLFPSAYPEFINDVISPCQNLQVFSLFETEIRCSLNTWNNSPCLPRLKKFSWFNNAHYDDYFHPAGFLKSIFTFLLKCSDDLQEVSMYSISHEQESALNDANFHSIFQQFAVKKHIEALSFDWFEMELFNFPSLDDFRHLQSLEIQTHLSTLLWHNSSASTFGKFSFRDVYGTENDALTSAVLSNVMTNLVHLDFFAMEFLVSPLSFAEMIIVKCPKLEKLYFSAYRNFYGEGKFCEEFLKHIRQLLAVSVPKRALRIVDTWRGSYLV